MSQNSSAVAVGNISPYACIVAWMMRMNATVIVSL